jgi:4-hydroxy-tetrahydrodipicolinate reductase
LPVRAVQQERSRIMKVGIFGFGRAGRSVATVFLQSPEVELEWVVRRSTKMEHRSVPEFLGFPSNDPGLIYSRDEFTAEELFERHPVDVVVDFSAEDGIDYYGEAAAKRDVAIVTAVSNYPRVKIVLLKKLARRTAVLWSPNITIGINFLMLASKVLQKIAPYTDIEIVEEHFKAKADVSGTAKRIADALGIKHSRIKKIRAGGIIGTHDVHIGSLPDLLLKHESILSRGGVSATEPCLRDESVRRKRGFYTMRTCSCRNSGAVREGPQGPLCGARRPLRVPPGPLACSE